MIKSITTKYSSFDDSYTIFLNLADYYVFAEPTRLKPICNIHLSDDYKSLYVAPIHFKK